jgi:hypothetical protein
MLCQFEIAKIAEIARTAKIGNSERAAQRGSKCAVSKEFLAILAILAFLAIQPKPRCYFFAPMLFS